MLKQQEITEIVKEGKHKPEQLRAYLLAHGCTKGTASKAVTVLVFINEEQIKPEDFTSLSAGYDLTRFIKKGWSPSV